MAQSAHDFSFTAIDGKPLPLKSFEGRALLVVNTASECGFTKQYSDLQELFDKYGERGLTVLGVPCNDFGGQEPGTEEQIAAFCSTRFGVTFPLTAKESVTGAKAHPFFKWAAGEVGPLGSPKWNFHKYLIGTDGLLVDWFSSVTSPSSVKVQRAVEAVLPAKDAR